MIRKLYFDFGGLSVCFVSKCLYGYWEFIGIIQYLDNFGVQKIFFYIEVKFVFFQFLFIGKNKNFLIRIGKKFF